MHNPFLIREIQEPLSHFLDTYPVPLTTHKAYNIRLLFSKGHIFAQKGEVLEHMATIINYYRDLQSDSI